jgi:hypothetical protein
VSVGRTLIATDLDRTLIYSFAAAGGSLDGLVPVERHEDADVSFMTARAAGQLAALAERTELVPVTTRVPAQWARIQLPGPPARYAIVANGAILLERGRVDADWSSHVARRLATVAPLDEVWAHVARVCRPEWTDKLRNAAGVFCYAVVRRRHLPPGALAESAEWAAGRGWRMSVQGRKVYWVPQPLTKSAAVAEVAARCGAGQVLAAGDSLLDLDLVRDADRGIIARHGELYASGWAAPHVAVTSASGVGAGEEIVAWFAAGGAD